MIRRYIFNIKYPERTWVVNLRRLKGRPSVENLFNVEGKRLKYKKKVIGDKLILLLPKAEKGVVHLKMCGDKMHFFNSLSIWLTLSTFINWFWRTK